jgi:hypothetical protein
MQMSGCLEPSTKIPIAGRAGNPGSQAHGYGSSAEVAMALKNRYVSLVGNTTIQGRSTNGCLFQSVNYHHGR